MKLTFSLLLVIFGCFHGMAQNVDTVISQKQLVGIWQIDKAVVGDALREHFTFFPDGRFLMGFNQYDDAQRVLALNGHYRINGGKLFMMVESRLEIVGGYFTKGSPGFQRAPFVLEGGKVQTIAQKDTLSEKDPFIISVLKRSGSGKVTGVKIGSNKYYKVSDNPAAYK